jgi:hypothetical protein
MLSLPNFDHSPKKGVFDISACVVCVVVAVVLGGGEADGGGEGTTGAEVTGLALGGDAAFGPEPSSRCQGRHTSSTAAPNTTTDATINRHRAALGLGADSVAGCPGAGAMTVSDCAWFSALCAAFAKSFAVLYRCLGFFARPTAITSSTAMGISRRCVEGFGGGAVMCAIATCSMVVPGKGSWPVTDW